MSGTTSLVAIKLLRDRADDVRSRATSATTLANHAWTDYLRRSENERRLWREHDELLAALKELEGVVV